jgi:hypothetical protein
MTERHFWASASDRRRARERLSELGARIRALVPGATLAADQAYRESTFACRNAAPRMSERIVAELTGAGAGKVVTSLWVLGWFGDFDKLAMTCWMLAELCAIGIEPERYAFIYVCDSLNDEPTFGFFPNSVGVAAVRRYVNRMTTPQQWVTQWRRHRFC